MFSPPYGTNSYSHGVRHSMPLNKIGIVPGSSEAVVSRFEKGIPPSRPLAHVMISRLFFFFNPVTGLPSGAAIVKRTETGSPERKRLRHGGHHVGGAYTIGGQTLVCRFQSLRRDVLKVFGVLVRSVGTVQSRTQYGPDDLGSHVSDIPVGARDIGSMCRVSIR